MGTLHPRTKGLTRGMKHSVWTELRHSRGRKTSQDEQETLRLHQVCRAWEAGLGHRLRRRVGKTAQDPRRPCAAWMATRATKAVGVALPWTEAVPERPAPSPCFFHSPMFSGFWLQTMPPARMTRRHWPSWRQPSLSSVTPWQGADMQEEDTGHHGWLCPWPRPPQAPSPCSSDC